MALYSHFSLLWHGMAWLGGRPFFSAWFLNFGLYFGVVFSQRQRPANSLSAANDDERVCGSKYLYEEHGGHHLLGISSSSNGSTSTTKQPLLSFKLLESWESYDKEATPPGLMMAEVK